MRVLTTMVTLVVAALLMGCSAEAATGPVDEGLSSFDPVVAAHHVKGHDDEVTKCDPATEKCEDTKCDPKTGKGCEEPPPKCDPKIEKCKEPPECDPKTEKCEPCDIKTGCDDDRGTTVTIDNLPDGTCPAGHFTPVKSLKNDPADRNGDRVVCTKDTPTDKKKKKKKKPIKKH